MSAAHRLDWLYQQVASGRLASVAFSYNEATMREKVKFVLWNSFSANGLYRPILLGALQAVSYAITHSIVTDKGHQSHSSGTSTVEFWIKQPPTDSNEDKQVASDTGLDIPPVSIKSDAVPSPSVRAAAVSTPSVHAAPWGDCKEFETAAEHSIAPRL